MIRRVIDRSHENMWAEEREAYEKYIWFRERTAAEWFDAYLDWCQIRNMRREKSKLTSEQ